MVAGEDAWDDGGKGEIERESLCIVSFSLSICTLPEDVMYIKVCPIGSANISLLKR